MSSAKEKAKVKPTVAVAIAQSVSVVSSIPIEQWFKDAFEAALNPVTKPPTPPIVPSYYPDNGYNNKLNAAIGAVNAGLLVTLGGLVSFNSAQTNAITKFISLVGGTPPDGKGAPFPTPAAGSNFWGCVSLESYAHNLDRIQYLGTQPQAPRQGGPYQPADITLLYDPRSGMSGAEVAGWTGGPLVQAGGDGTAVSITHAFHDITTRAVIISADPFFHRSREPLISAANASGKYICYPLDNYRNRRGNHVPQHGWATVYGPKIEDGITMLGQMARTVLSTGGAVTAIGRVALGNASDL
jgi:hypothetical protein